MAKSGVAASAATALVQGAARVAFGGHCLAGAPEQTASTHQRGGECYAVVIGAGGDDRHQVEAARLHGAGRIAVDHRGGKQLKRQRFHGAKLQRQFAQQRVECRQSGDAPHVVTVCLAHLQGRPQDAQAARDADGRTGAVERALRSDAPPTPCHAPRCGPARGRRRRSRSVRSAAWRRRSTPPSPFAARPTTGAGQLRQRRRPARHRRRRPWHTPRGGPLPNRLR